MDNQKYIEMIKSEIINRCVQIRDANVEMRSLLGSALMDLHYIHQELERYDCLNPVRAGILNSIIDKVHEATRKMEKIEDEYDKRLFKMEYGE